MTATAPSHRARRAPVRKPAGVDTTVSVEPLEDTTDVTDSKDLYPPDPRTDVRVPVVEPSPVERMLDAAGIEGPEEDDDDPESPYISFIGATKRYDISRQALHALCAKGRIPFYLRYNGRRRFLRSEADEYLGLTRVEATDPLPKRNARG